MRDGMQEDLLQLWTLQQCQDLARALGQQVSYVGYGPTQQHAQKQKPPLSDVETNAWWKHGKAEFKQSLAVMKQMKEARDLPETFFWKCIPAILDDEPLGPFVCSSSAMEEDNEEQMSMTCGDDATSGLDLAQRVMQERMRQLRGRQQKTTRETQGPCDRAKKSLGKCACTINSKIYSRSR